MASQWLVAHNLSTFFFELFNFSVHQLLSEGSSFLSRLVLISFIALPLGSETSLLLVHLQQRVSQNDEEGRRASPREPSPDSQPPIPRATITPASASFFQPTKAASHTKDAYPLVFPSRRLAIQKFRRTRGHN